MKNRLIRVRELLQRELGSIIAREHAFPNVLVTVNDVDITPDLKHAYVYIGVIGPEHRAEHVVEVLNHRHGELQTRVSKRVILKNTPRFHFRLDHSVERGVRITSIMETIDQQLAASAARDAEAGTVDTGGADETVEIPGDKSPPPPASPQAPGRSPRHFPSSGDDD